MDYFTENEPSKECEFCEGTGKVNYPVYNEDSHEYEDVGEKDCVCVTGRGYPRDPEDY